MSKGGSKTTTSTQSTQIDPAYLSKWNDVYNMASNYANQAYTPYTGDLTADFTTGQNQAYTGAQNNATSAQGLNSYGLLGSLMGQNAGTVGGTDLSQYMNPYTQNVVDKTLGQIDIQRMKALQGVGDQAQSNGAFGGDRQAILEAETNKQYGDLAGLAASNLYSQAYNNAQNMAQQDVQNRLSNMSQQAGLAGQALGAQNSALAQLMAMGSTDQTTQQNALNAAYQQFVEGRDWNKNNATYLAGILGATPYNTTSTNTQTQKNSGGLLNSLLGVGSMIAGIPGAGNALGSLIGLGGGDSQAGILGISPSNSYEDPTTGAYKFILP